MLEPFGAAGTGLPGAGARVSEPAGGAGAPGAGFGLGNPGFGGADLGSAGFGGAGFGDPGGAGLGGAGFGDPGGAGDSGGASPGGAGDGEPGGAGLGELGAGDFGAGLPGAGARVSEPADGAAAALPPSAPRIEIRSLPETDRTFVAPSVIMRAPWRMIVVSLPEPGMRIRMVSLPLTLPGAVSIIVESTASTVRRIPAAANLNGT